MAETGYDDFMRSDQESSSATTSQGRIAEHGPGCRKTSPTGKPVVAMPLLRRAGRCRR